MNVQLLKRLIRQKNYLRDALILFEPSSREENICRRRLINVTEQIDELINNSDISELEKTEIRNRISQKN